MSTKTTLRVAMDAIRWVSFAVVIALLVYVLFGGEAWLASRTSDTIAMVAGVTLAVLAVAVVLVDAYDLWQWYRSRKQ